MKAYKMSQSISKAAAILSFIIAGLMMITSAGGLVIPSLYRDNLFVTAALRGNDLVSLAVAAPLLMGAVILSRRGSKRALLVWVGMLDYALYNFAFYLFGAAFNIFFLLYVALFALSIYALVYLLVGIDAEAIARQFRPQTPVRWISGFMLLVAVGLSVLWVGTSVDFIVTGQVPAMVETVEHPTNITAALDLTFVVSVLVLGAVWLWQRRPWGYVLIAASAVKGAVYNLALTAGTVSGMLTGIEGSAEQIPLWGGLAASFLIVTVILLGNMQPDSTSHQTNDSKSNVS
jgi:hypothetical protein